MHEYLLLSPGRREIEREVSGVKIIYLKDLLEQKKNETILEKLATKPAMYSEMYSSKDELEIFTGLFEDAIKNNKKIHII